MLKNVQNEFKALGTDIDIKIVLNGGKAEKAKKTLKEIEVFYFEKEKIFSRFDKESELMRLNANLGKFREASHDMIEIAEKALFYYNITKGFFDPRIIGILEGIGYDRDFLEINSVPTNKKSLDIQRLSDDLSSDLKICWQKIFFGTCMDFSGIAKGYITDRASEFLKGKGFENFLIDSGGDMYASGTDKNNNFWNISIEGTDENKLSFSLSGRGIATSGITRRKWEKNGQKFHHLVNPKKPQEFLFDLKTVTVISENTEKADIWAKTLFLMGRENGIEFSNENNIASVFLDYKGNVYLSSKMKDYIAKSSS